MKAIYVFGQSRSILDLFKLFKLRQNRSREMEREQMKGRTTRVTFEKIESTQQSVSKRSVRTRENTTKNKYIGKQRMLVAIKQHKQRTITNNKVMRERDFTYSLREPVSALSTKIDPFNARVTVVKASKHLSKRKVQPARTIRWFLVFCYSNQKKIKCNGCKFIHYVA